MRFYTSFKGITLLFSIFIVMKSLFQLVCCLLLLVVAEQAFAQITVNPPIINRPSAYLNDWEGRASTATIQVNNNGTTSKVCKIWVQIFLDNVLVAYSQPAKLQPITIIPGPHFYSGEELVPLSSVHFENTIDDKSRRAGRIPDGRVCLRVHVVDATTNAELAVSPDGCANIISYYPPELRFPENDAELCKVGMDNVIYTRNGSPLPIFQWIPIVPSPTSLVTYHFAIFEILPTQEPIAAMRGARPLFERDLIGQTSLIWPLEYFFPEPGKFYTWSVRALDINGNTLVQSNDGWAAPFRFSVLKDCGNTNTSDNSDSIRHALDSINNATNGNNTNGQGSTTGADSTGKNAPNDGDNGTIDDQHWGKVVDELQKAQPSSLGLFYDNKQVGHIIGMEFSDPQGVRSSIGSIEHCSNFDENAETSKWVLFACEDVVSPLDVLRILSESKNSSYNKSLEVVYQGGVVFAHSIRFHNPVITEVSFPSLSAGAQGSHASPLIIKIKVESLESSQQTLLHYIPKDNNLGISRLTLNIGNKTLGIANGTFCARFFKAKSITTDANCSALAKSILLGNQFRGAMIAQMFQTYLHRAPGAAETNAFLAQLNSGVTLDNILAFILGSSEYFSLHSGTNVAFINGVYTDLLSRPPSTPESQPFLQSLNQNTLTRQAFAQLIISSTEYRSILIGLLYNQFLHRAPTAPEKDTWIAFLNSGKSSSDLMIALVSSEEYYKLSGGNCLAELQKDLKDNSLQSPEVASSDNGLLLELSGSPLVENTVAYIQQWFQSGESRSMIAHFTSAPGALQPISLDLPTIATVKQINPQTSSVNFLCKTSRF